MAVETFVEFEPGFYVLVDKGGGFHRVRRIGHSGRQVGILVQEVLPPGLQGFTAAPVRQDIVAEIVEIQFAGPGLGFPGLNGKVDVVYQVIATDEFQIWLKITTIPMKFTHTGLRRVEGRNHGCVVGISQNLNLMFVIQAVQKREAVKALAFHVGDKEMGRAQLQGIRRGSIVLKNNFQLRTVFAGQFKCLADPWVAAADTGTGYFAAAAGKQQKQEDWETDIFHLGISRLFEGSKIATNRIIQTCWPIPQVT